MLGIAMTMKPIIDKTIISDTNQDIFVPIKHKAKTKLRPNRAHENLDITAPII
jgi:hypothetical protein